MEIDAPLQEPGANAWRLLNNLVKNGAVGELRPAHIYCPRIGPMQSPRQRRFLQPMLSLGVVGLAGLVIAATLSGRPSIRPPKQLGKWSDDAGFDTTLARVNRQLREMAADVDHQLAADADSLTIARRISLGLVGSGLSLEEVRALEQIAEHDRIEWWTAYMLEDQRWSDYFAERLSRAFVGTDDGSFLLFRRRKFNAWLSEQLSRDVGYDRIVRAMIAAEGLWTDTPQVNFLTATFDGDDTNRADPIRLAGRTARVFLGQRIDCLECHDDFLGNLDFGTQGESTAGIQQHFHELAAFYAGTTLPEVPFRGIRDDGTPYRYQYLGVEQEQTVEPRVPFAQHLLLEDGKPRVRLAKWVTHPDNHAFARAAVNRIWALLFSRPLVEPVDSIPLDDSVPAVLDTLAEDFAAHGFNLKRLIQLIVATDAFQRDSRANFPITEDHEACWAVFPITQLRPEQVSGSLFQACRLTAINASSSIITRLQKFGETQDFLKQFGDRGEDEFNGQAVTLTQRLVLMNGKLISDRTKNDLINSAATRIARLVSDDPQVVELSFLSVLNRRPHAKELEIFEAHLSGTRGDQRIQAVNDLYWAILNSTEFSWNH